MDRAKLNYASGQFVIAVFKLAADAGDLKQRIEAAKAELIGHVATSDLPDEFKTTYHSLLAIDLDYLIKHGEPEASLSLVHWAGELVGLAFGICEAASKASPHLDG